MLNRCILSLIIIFQFTVFCQLEVGDIVPNFYLPDELGVLHNLSEFRGRKVAVVFYPKNGSPYCKLQAQALRDAFIQLEKENIVVLAVNTESIEDHKAFKDEFNFPFLLLTADAKTVENFGVSDWFGYVKRKTFLLDEAGVLVAVIDDVKLTKHHEQIVEGFNKAESLIKASESDNAIGQEEIIKIESCKNVTFVD